MYGGSPSPEFPAPSLALAIPVAVYAGLAALAEDDAETVEDPQ